MPTSINVRTCVLALHGSLSLFAGLAFLYLHALMTNLLFDVAAAVSAFIFSVAALLMAAVIDSLAAFATGITKVHQFAVYLLAALGAALAALIIGYHPAVSLQLLAAFAAAHALLFGLWGLAFAGHASYARGQRVYIGAFGLLSIVFAIYLGRNLHVNDSIAIARVGAYTCFVGIKMLLFAWQLHRLSTADLRPHLSASASGTE
jgi:hypothetical protein